MTGAGARGAWNSADVLCGYTVYVDLVKHLYPDKETYATPMTRELERCRWALETAAAGRTVAMVCSGDAGVYGMAGPLLQLAGEYRGVEVEVVPGVTSALSRRGGAGRAADARFLRDLPVGSAHALGADRASAGPCGGGGLCPYACTTRPPEKAGGLSAPGLRYPAAGQKPGHCLRLGAQHRPGGPAAPPADAGPSCGRSRWICSPRCSSARPRRRPSAGRMVTPRGYEAKR